MENLIVIHEIDKTDNDHIVIGVADSVKHADLLIKEYYGDYTTVSYTDIRDSNIEWQKTLEVLDHLNEPYEVKVWLEWFRLNRA